MSVFMDNPFHMVDKAMTMFTEAEAFWNNKTLGEMSAEEWELLCDGCGRCCLHKLEDIDTGLYFYTNVACHLLNQESCRCTNYQERLNIVPDCLRLSAGDAGQFEWLPTSCAYRRLANGQALEWWHPLVSGDPATVHRAGISVRGKTTSENEVSRDQLEHHVIHWIDF
jgi:uncharacterized cysteine cluster protein YcgN (CxxCxxCC family)